MTRRLLVNDCLSALPGHRTFWNDLQEWFGCEFVGGDYATLAEKVHAEACEWSSAIFEKKASLIIRNGSYFGPIRASELVPTISLLQDIFTEGPAREMQEAVIASSRAVVFNSAFTRSRYGVLNADAPPDFSKAFKTGAFLSRVIPLPVDFTVFEPGNAMGLQQALSLPDGSVCWIGACREAGHIKGWDIFIAVARANPDLHFVAVLKDAMPESFPPNVRCYVRLTHADLAKVIGACRVGLCTSRVESQHLAGIEMGACGLPLVVPRVGVYFNRPDLPGVIVSDPKPEMFTGALRACHLLPGDREKTRAYWRREFDRAVIREAWTKLVEEVENADIRRGTEQGS